jgi:segregation and condensation protein B
VNQKTTPFEDRDDFHENRDSDIGGGAETAELDELFNDLVDDTTDETDALNRWDQDPVARMRRVETVLFLGRKPITLRKIAETAFLEDATQARTIIGELNARYDHSGQSFHIKHIAGGYQMMTRPQFSDWIGRLEHLSQPLRLSAPAMETLTVVAYRQPIIKAEIEAIRGVACGEMLRQLLEFNLLKIAGRSEKLGRPFLYATTKEFLTLFGLSSLQELPKAKELLGIGLPEWATHDNNFDHLKYGSSNAAD